MTLSPIIYLVNPSVEKLIPDIQNHIGYVLKDFLKNFIYDVDVKYMNSSYSIITIGQHTTIPSQIKLTIDSIIYTFNRDGTAKPWRPLHSFTATAVQQI